MYLWIVSASGGTVVPPCRWMKPWRQWSLVSQVGSASFGGLGLGLVLASAVFRFFANRAYARDRNLAKRPLFTAMGLGAFFVVFQGYEWVMLIRQGLTLTSSIHGSFFFLIVGMHGLHAVAGLTVLGRASLKLSKGLLAPSTFAAAQVFWYFVVGLWPVLYFMVYL